MKFFRRIQEYMNRAREVLRDKGLKVFLQALMFKLQSVFKRKPRLSLRAWLVYYQNRGEFHLQPEQDKDVDQYPKVSILILTYNNLIFTKICLHSIYSNTTYLNFEVIVVDNNSKDETPSWLTTFAQSHPNLKVILNSTNLGFAAGNNQAAKEAAGEYLLFLNNDTVVTSGWLEKSLGHIQSNPKIGLIGPVTNATGNEARIPVSYMLPMEMEAFAANRAQTMANKAFDIRMLAFYCVLARKEQFDQLGGLDERFAVGMFEDDDLAVRYYQAGFKVVCAEDVFIHHFQSASFGKLNKAHYEKIFAENRKKYEEKWGRKWEPYKQRELLFAQSGRPGSRPYLKPWEILFYRCNICGRACGL